MVRNFGMGGQNLNVSSATSSLPNFIVLQTAAAAAPGGITKALSYYYGNDPLNVSVSSQAAFTTAVGYLRGQYGRSYSPPNTWVYPPAWAQVDANMAFTDTSSNVGEMTGNPLDTVNRLAALGIQTLGVSLLPCNQYVFQSMDPTSALYWRERWELYKHTYVVAGWFWKRAMQRVEFWNEPDLGGLPCINASTWLEHLTLRSMAIQNAYADFNADVQANNLPCPANAAPLGLSCPISPIVVVSAFANGGMSLPAAGTTAPCVGAACLVAPGAATVCSGTGATATCFFGAQTIANEHLTFPPQSGTMNNTWYNGQAFSFHR